MTLKKQPPLLTQPATLDLLWWEVNISGSYASILSYSLSMTLNTGALSKLWGASMGDIRIEVFSCIEECDLHINILEFKGTLMQI